MYPHLCAISPGSALGGRLGTGPALTGRVPHSCGTLGTAGDRPTTSARVSRRTPIRDPGTPPSLCDAAGRWQRPCGRGHGGCGHSARRLGRPIRRCDPDLHSTITGTHADRSRMASSKSTRRARLAFRPRPTRSCRYSRHGRSRERPHDLHRGHRPRRRVCDHTPLRRHSVGRSWRHLPWQEGQLRRHGRPTATARDAIGRAFVTLVSAPDRRAAPVGGRRSHRRRRQGSRP